jgi:hypothetical protein
MYEGVWVDVPVCGYVKVYVCRHFYYNEVDTCVLFKVFVSCAFLYGCEYLRVFVRLLVFPLN